MAEYTVDTLAIKVEDQSDKAGDGIGKLADSLTKLKGSVQGSTKGLTSLSTKLSELKTATNNLSVASTNLKELADALKGISGLSKINIPKSLAERMTEIGAAMENITDDGVDRLDRMTAALQRLSGVDLGGLPSALRAASGGGTGGVLDASVSDDVNSVTEQIRQLRDDLSDINKTRVKPKIDTSEVKKATNETSTLATLLKSIARIAWYRAIRSALSSITDGLKEVAQQDESANQTLSEIVSSVHYLRDAIVAAILPALNAINPILTTILDTLAEAFNFVAKIIGFLTGQETVAQATKQQINFTDSLESTASAAKEALKYLLPIDELNIMDGTSGSGGGTSTGGGHYEPTSTSIGGYSASDFMSDLTGMVMVSPSWSPDPVPAPSFEAVTIPKEAGATIESPVWSPDPIPAPDMETEPLLTELDLLETDVDAIVGVMNADLAKIHIPELDTQPAITEIDLLETDSNAVVERIDADLQKLKEQFDTILNGIKSRVLEWKESLQTNLKGMSDYIATVFKPALESAGNSILVFLRNSAQNVQEWAQNIGTNIQAAMLYIPQAVSSGLTEAGQSVSDWINSTSQNLADWGNNLVKNAGTAVSGFYKNFVSGLSDAWTAFKDFLSATGEKVTGWWSANKSWVAPVAAAGVTTLAVGSIILSGGASIPAISGLATPALAAIPALASGGVLTEPTTVLAGEYPNARTNPEIVTPQNIMRETFREEQNTEELLNALYAVGNMIVKAIEDKETTSTWDPQSVSRTLRPYLNELDRIKGPSLVT